jgi:hypothetical protein
MPGHDEKIERLRIARGRMLAELAPEQTVSGPPRYCSVWNGDADAHWI